MILGAKGMQQQQPLCRRGGAGLEGMLGENGWVSSEVEVGWRG